MHLECTQTTAPLSKDMDICVHILHTQFNTSVHAYNSRAARSSCQQQCSRSPKQIIPKEPNIVQHPRALKSIGNGGEWDHSFLCKHLLWFLLQTFILIDPCYYKYLAENKMAMESFPSLPYDRAEAAPWNSRAPNPPAAVCHGETCTRFAAGWHKTRPTFLWHHIQTHKSGAQASQEPQSNTSVLGVLPKFHHAGRFPSLPHTFCYSLIILTSKGHQINCTELPGPILSTSSQTSQHLLHC